MNGSLFNVIWALMFPPVFAVIWHGLFRRAPRWRGHVRVSRGSAGFGGTLSWGTAGQLIPAGISAAWLIIAVIMWWLSRRRRKRAPKAAGAKSRALIAAMVAKMRESGKPRPVLRPVPGGAS